MKKAIMLLVAIFVISSIIFAGCAAPAPASKTAPTPAPAAAPAQGPIKGGVMNISTTRPPVKFGYPPQIAGSDNNPARPFFDSLISMDNNGAYQPELATSWDVAPDGKSITFKLRQGVKFHDGTDFNADAVKFNYDQYLPPKSNVLAGVSSIEKVDGLTVKFNLPSYSNLLLYSLAIDMRCGIASPTAIQKNGVDWSLTNPVGTGPFKLKNFERNTSITYVRNPDYWDKSLPYLDEMKLTGIPDPMTQLAAFKAGEINVIWDARPQIVDQLRKEGYQFFKTPGTLQGIAPDTDHPDSVFAKQKVREAIEYAIDKEAIVNGPGLGLYESAYQIVANKSPDYNPACQPRKYDPEKAKQLLTEAGYPNGFSFKYLINETDWTEGPAAVQNYLSKVGITMDIVRLATPAYESTVRMGKLAEKNSGAATAIPMYSQNLFMINAFFISNSNFYQSMVEPAGLDDLISRAIAARNDQDRIKLTQDVTKAVYDNASFTPFWIQPRLMIVDKKIQNPGFMINNDTLNARIGRSAWLKP
jgi:peptide/nickel transport system substrate-binding protein